MQYVISLMSLLKSIYPMHSSYRETYTKQDYTNIPWQNWEYEDCEFVGCNFSWVDISHTRFIDCRFIGCNLSNIQNVGTGWQDVDFEDCKILGVRFDAAQTFLFEIGARGCVFDYCSFSGMKMSRTVFTSSSWVDTDWSGTDISECVFDDCDMRGARYARTDMRWADFSSARDYIIDPEDNQVEGARFSLAGTPGLLTKYHIIIE